jgi:hypothetical protein
MKKLLLAMAFSILSPVAVAADIDPATVVLPWLNGPTRGSVYRFTDHSNRVHLIEAWTIGCSWCNRNAAQVKALKQEYATDAGVEFLDLGLDSNASAYAQWIQSHRPTYPVVQDAGRAIWTALKQADGVPQTFVVDCKGHLVDYTIGYWGESEKTSLRAAIALAKETSCD